MNQFMKLALLSLVAVSLLSCGNSGKKKNSAADRKDDKVSNPLETNSDALKDKDELFQKNIERRLQFENEFAPQVYLANKDEQGTLKLIFLPANHQSVNKNDHKPLWFFNAKNNDEDGTNAYVVMSKSKGLEENDLPFSLAPLDEDLDEIFELDNQKIHIIDNETISVHCGSRSLLYSKDRIATADNMNFHILSDKNSDLFKSPCSFFNIEEEELIVDESDNEIRKNEEEVQEMSDSQDQDVPISHCTDSQEETIASDEDETDTQYIQGAGAIKIKGTIRCFHEFNKPDRCVVIKSEVVNHGQEHHQSNSCIYTAAPIEQVEASHQPSQAQEIESILLSDTDLPYCKSEDQRGYLKRVEKIEEHKKEIVFLANYCKLRPELGELCKAEELHKQHQKIEQRRKQMGRILSRCHKRKVAKLAKRNDGRPEMNTCGIINRVILKNKRIKADRLENKIQDLKANCHLDPNMCSDKKLTRLEKHLKKTQASVERREKNCNTHL